ncbi:MAG TPA: phospholipase D family protein [Tepidisphaeraceae bacterium]|jgi:phosphatidylserine/phosphatidylglycerophosphate/cardiolipin synthase-like enzyme|nr:phospholipase D family protein [Tepidisphaeraceae bacterium]
MRKKLLLAIAFSLGIWAYLLVLAAPRFGSASASVNNPGAEDGINAFFSPNGGCTDAIVTELSKATKSIDVQAYSFTSPPLAQALVDANNRGVMVRIVLDKGQRTDHYSSATFFLNHHVPVYIDDQHAIAHNKIMLIDGKVLITGSFNFTRASEDRNAENLLIIHDRPKLLAAYVGNFEHHFGHSIPMVPEDK